MNDLDEWFESRQTKAIINLINKHVDESCKKLHTSLCSTQVDSGFVRYKAGIIQGLLLSTNKEFIESLINED